MKVAIAPMVYRRPEVFEVFAQGVHNLINTFKDVEFKVICIGSEDEAKARVEAHGFTYYQHKNKPLTAKAEYRLKKVKELDCDYWLSLSDDDFITPAYFGYVLEKMYQGYEYIAPYDLYYIRNMNLYYYAGYPENNLRHNEALAVGKLVSTELLDRLDWTLWSARDLDSGLDRLAWGKLVTECKSKHFFRCKEIGGMVVDVKSTVNISKWSKENIQVTNNLELLFADSIHRKLRKVPHAL